MELNMVESCVTTWLLYLPGYLDADSTGERHPCDSMQLLLRKAHK